MNTAPENSTAYWTGWLSMAIVLFLRGTEDEHHLRASLNAFLGSPAASAELRRKLNQR